MEPLRTFLMEDHLESFRFTARFNLGESGHRHRTVGELLRGSGVSDAQAAEVFSSLLLRDSPNWGRLDLRQQVAAMHPGASVENVLITTGTSEALFLLFRQLRPKKVALAMPAFQLLYEIPLSMGAAIVSLPVRWGADGRPEVDEAEWISTLERERPDVVILNNPHNPTGMVFPPALLERVAGWVASAGAALVGDEHYRFLSSDEAPLGPTVYRPGGRVFVTGSYIKCLGCPGLRIGWCVGDTATLSRMQNEKNYTTHTVNPITEWISAEVLRDLHSPVMTAARQEWKDNRRILEAFLQRSKHFYGVAPRGGIVTGIGLRGVDTPARFEAAASALEQASVFLLPLSAMEHGGGDGHPLARGHGFRMGVGIDPGLLPLAVEAMEAAAAAALR